MSDIIDAFTINQRPVSFDKEQFSYIPSMLEKKITLVATAILFILAVCYASYHYYSSRKKNRLEKEKPVAKKVEKSENEPLLTHPSLINEHSPFSNYNFNQIVINPNEKKSEIKSFINIPNKNKKENCTLSIELQTFYDKIKNEKPIEILNGQGEITQSDGTYLKGTFINNLLTGEGEKKYANGDYQKGTFANNELNGFGIKHCNGITYEGTFENGQLKGKGEIKYPSGRHEKGEFENNLLKGKGEKVIPGQGIMKGMFKQGKLNGPGIIEFEDGVVWKGEFIDDFLNGKGIMIMDNGNINLEGIFINNVYQRVSLKKS